VKKFLLVIFASSYLLTGCFSITPYSSEFSCPGYHPGVCGSIPDVYRMYKRGAFREKNEGKTFEVRRYSPQECTKSVRNGKTVVVCRPDKVSRHTDYRAEAVKTFSGDYE